MPLSISSSSSTTPSDRAPRGPTVIAWLLTVIIAGATLCGAEWFWRGRGLRPSVVDDRDFWAYHRSQVYVGGQKSVVLVGASRIQLDFSTSTFRKLFPDHHLVQLAIDGKYPLATLHDLANDEKFQGIVICGIDSQGLRRANRDAQQDYVDYYRREATRNNMLNSQIGCWLQSQLVVMSPQVNLKKVTVRMLRHLPLPKPVYLTTHFDRSRSADYEMIDLKEHRQWRIDRMRNRRKEVSTLSPEQWLAEAFEIEPAIEKIQKRGGQVVLVHLPISGPTLEAAERNFPKVKFWDRFAANTRAVAIHFLDHPQLANFECPDTSHLDYRDAPRFTVALLEILTERGVLRRQTLWRLSEPPADPVKK